MGEAMGELIGVCGTGFGEDALNDESRDGWVLGVGLVGDFGELGFALKSYTATAFLVESDRDAQAESDAGGELRSIGRSAVFEVVGQEIEEGVFFVVVEHIYDFVDRVESKIKVFHKKRIKVYGCKCINKN